MYVPLNVIFMNIKILNHVLLLKKGSLIIKNKFFVKSKYLFTIFCQIL